MKRTLNTLFTIFCLLSTSVVTVATSKKSDNRASGQLGVDSMARKDYFVASNCPQAVYQERITVANDAIEYPTNMTFYDFGIPVHRLNLAHSTQVGATVNGRQRSCLRSELVDQGYPVVVFTCSENGHYLCQVSFDVVQ